MRLPADPADYARDLYATALPRTRLAILSGCRTASGELSDTEGASSLMKLLVRKSVLLPFVLAQEYESVFLFMQKYADVPMSLADACLVRMTETLPDPIVLTADSDFRVYRRHSRHVIPCAMPR